MAFARKERIMPKPLQLDLVVSDSVKLVRRLVTEQVKVSVDLRAPACFVLADAVQIEQILLNLATNARDAMPEGGSLTIETRVVSPSRVSGHSLKPAFRYTRIIVRDTGAGMDEATRTRLFEPFFTTKEIGKGTGLGLATVYAVTRELGADIEVESAPGQGTTFALTIPCCDSPTSVTEDLTAAPVVLHGTVLLVDDDPAVRSTVRGYLETTGLEVIEASTVEEALQLHATADTIVTDVVMPTMSGPRLVAEIRRTRPGIRALYISAHPLDYLVEAKTLDRGAAFVQKPFSKEQLASALATVIG
jgi:CheY-like chemotaxis protein